MVKSKRPQRQSFPISSLTRRPGKLPPAKSVLIVCGGTKTEPNYFQAVRRQYRLTAVEIVATRLGPVGVVREAVSLANKRKQAGEPIYDELWCVLDVENLITNPSFPQAVNEGKTHQLGLAVSNPAFEYWLLLHFQETTRPYHDASDLLADLRVHLPNYQKNLTEFAVFLERMDMAIERAARIWSDHPDKGTGFPNPSTTVFILVRSLIRVTV